MMDRFVIRRKRKPETSPEGSPQVHTSDRKSNEQLPKKRCKLTVENSIAIANKNSLTRLSLSQSSSPPATTQSTVTRHSDNRSDSSRDLTCVSVTVPAERLAISTKSKCVSLTLRKISAENLDCDYGLMYSKQEADNLLGLCEKQFEYNTGRLAEVQIFGKWFKIPRKQVDLPVVLYIQIFMPI